jgi:hypothetical protein
LFKFSVITDGTAISSGVSESFVITTSSIFKVNFNVEKPIQIVVKLNDSRGFFK